MPRGEVRAVTSNDLAKYDFLCSRISELEAEQVETRLRPAESKLRGLQQTLASYKGTLQELHEISQRRHWLTHKAQGSFDLLGRKHKQRKVEEQLEREEQACKAESAQKERIAETAVRLEQHRELVLELRRKTRELDAVRQAESDLVDRLFRSEDIVMDSQHGALEDAVCALAPRLLMMRDTVATAASVDAKLDNAAQQLKAAAEELEHAFEPAHRALKDKFGDETGEEFYDPADEVTKINAVRTADKLLKAAVHNLTRARRRIEVLPGLQPEESQSLASCLEPVLQPGADINSLAMRKLVRDSTNTIYVLMSQTEYAAQCVSDKAVEVRQELRKVEYSLNESKGKLDSHRRQLLSQVQEAKRSHSLHCSQDGSYSGSVSDTGFDIRSRLAKRFGAIGNKVPSVNSGLSSMG